jgi:adenosylmethionine-8-amino-7-oxononanoate aminotransferase
MFACEHEGVTPDIMTLAKGITGGYLPLAATLATDNIFEAFLTRYEDRKTFYHGHTYTGNPLSCAAAIANLEIFKHDNVIKNLKQKINNLQRSLKKISEMDHVGDVRQRGMMAGIELVKDKTTREPFPPDLKMGINVCMRARDYGVILRPLGDVVVLMPPLCITNEQCRKMIEAVKFSIRDVAGIKQG